THAPNASSSNSTGLAPDWLSPSIAVSTPPAFTPVNLNPLFQLNFTVRSLIRVSLLWPRFAKEPWLYFVIISFRQCKESSQPSLLRVIPHQPFGDAAWLISAFTLDRDVPGQLLAARNRFDRLQGDARPNLRSGGNRRRKTDFVQPVVD